MLGGSVATNCCCTILDGMDQAKFKCPRTKEQSSKLYSQLYRPRLHVAGTWIHGHCLHMAIADEDFPKDAVCELEQLARGVDALFRDFGTLPLGLACQADNTYREFKNRHCVGFLILLTALGCFRWTTASFLRVGHSCLVCAFIFRT